MSPSATGLSPLAAALAERQPARLQLRGACVGHRAQLLANLAAELRRSLVIVVRTPKEAEALVLDLRFFLPANGPLAKGAVHLFPQWEILPYEEAPLNPVIVRARMEVLHAARAGAPCCLVTTARALMQKLPPVATFDQMSFSLAVGEEQPVGVLLRRLLEAGYRQTAFVETPGEVAHRGGIVDLFSPRHPWPVRVELFGDEIESIRPFDPTTQRSRAGLDAVEVGPTHELLLTEARRLAAAAWVEEKSPRLAERLRHGLPEGMEHLYALFHDGYHTLFDYLASDFFCVFDDPARLAADALEFTELVAARQAAAAVERPIVAEIATPFMDYAEVVETVELVDQLHLLATAAPADPALGLVEVDAAPVVLVGEGMKERLRALTPQLRLWCAARPVLLAVASEGQMERFTRLFADLELATTPLASMPPPAALVPGLYLIRGELSRSFAVGEVGPLFLAEADLAGQRQHLAVRKPTTIDEVLHDLRAVKTGDYVVHLRHGIGRYTDLVTLTAAGLTQEFLQVEYAGGDKLFVPVGELDQVSRYIGEEGRAPALSKLGSPAWERAKAQTRKGVELVARELVELYAARAASEGFTFSAADDAEYLEFEATFPYDETPDQEETIRQVLADMASPKVMDRLVCGDVGFGKTEVAMRAACRAVLDSKQVVLLAPTTLLAEQHDQSFTARFANLPVRIGHLSRLLSPKEQQQVVEEARAGRVDILIGTHRLLSRDLAFSDLGLIIVDEEQRFGVRQKERLKSLKTRADCLTLTATPIPRTLHMAMAGLRDISVITTPPLARLPVATRILHRDDGVLADALARELARGGQVYWIHNRVQTIGRAAEAVARLAPHARVAIAHGQMEKHELSRVMTAFRDREHDILVTTTIIESGIDLPRVNTIIIDRADTLGLAQLYQLRGRVGRSSHQAYCYLITPPETQMTEEAQERLAALAEHTSLGSGFQIAAHDLEIRGGGNLLGAQQAGKIAAVGYDLYVRLVEEAVAQLQGRPVEELFAPKVTLDCSAYLPSDYVHDPHERLHLYQQIATLSDREQAEDAFAALVDRYGQPPAEVRALLLTTEARILAQRLRAEEVKLSPDGLIVHFSARSRVDPAAVLALRQRHGPRVELRGEYTLHLRARDDHRETVATRVHDGLALLEELGGGE